MQKDKNLIYKNEYPIIRRLQFKDWILGLGVLLIDDVILLLNFTYKGSVCVNSLIFTISCIISLQTLTKTRWTEFFKSIGIKDILFMLGILFLNFLYVIIANLLVKNSVSNPITNSKTFIDFIQVVLKIIIQILGETLIFFIPFLVVLSFLSRYSFSKFKVYIASILSSILFGLLHLPTYGWNLKQCLLLISGGAFIESLLYIKTKNLTTLYVTHVIYDIILVSIIFFRK